ncbi:fasciculation and elongation zeta-2 [Brachionus plicatilis]|uniref:Fasciculation and elongation zeta-2 n=1 Tax=Brachionus plicatilis TaxID=10195 RepID=A0A3M7R096_BRAPC|nr:fasciculation and elongation zeta-2 [Brachionus plicatilis]
MLYEPLNKNYMSNMHYSIDETEEEIQAPIAKIDIDEFLDNYINDQPYDGELKENEMKNSKALGISLEDLVQSFDKNVKECLRNYKNIDIGQLAPVQVRSQDDLISDSQMWYTLTGNFGNLLPIDYHSKKSLIRQYHMDSLNLKNQFDLEYFSDEGVSEDDLSQKDENDEFLEFDEDDEELKEQLDMHSMILIKGMYNESDLVEPLITAEQVLNEIDSMMSLEDEIYDATTPDSGFYAINSSVMSPNGDIPLELSYIQYINAFENELKAQSINQSAKIQLDNKFLMTPSKQDLEKLNIFELNEILEQTESHIKELSEVMVQEFATRDELEFEKETRNTFISLMTSINEKRRQLSIDNFNNSSLCKKKNRKSVNLDLSSSYLTTVIPYNSEIEYDIAHIQILNKLLKAIDENSHQVPDLLTNYILKVVCPT